MYVDLRTIRKLQHEKRGGDIYENGELIPLSKFDWLIQKQEVKEHKEIKIEDRLLKVGNQKYSFDEWVNGLIEIDSFDTLLDNFPINERLKILDESKKIVKKLANIELNRLKSEFETRVSKTISYPKLLELELKYYESILESDLEVVKDSLFNANYIKSPRYGGTEYPQEFINEVRKAYQNVIYGNIDTIIANPKNEHSFSYQFETKTFASITAIAFGQYYEYLKGLNPQNFEKSEEIMTFEQLKEKVRYSISKAKIEDAMNFVATWAYENNQEQLKNDVALLKHDLKTLDRDKIMDLKDNDEIGLIQRQLNSRLLNLLNNIDKGDRKEQTLQNIFQQIFDKIDELKDFHINIDRGNIVEHNRELYNFLGRESSKTIAKKWVIGLEDYFIEKSKSEIFNRLESDKIHFKNAQFNNIETFNRLIENSKAKDEIQKLEMGKEDHLLFYHFFYNSIALIENFILNNVTYSTSQSKNAKEEENNIKKFTAVQQTRKTILFITSSPNNLSVQNVDRQERSIKEAMRDKRKEDFYEIKRIGFVQPEDLIDEIEDAKPDIIHFYMHNNTETGLYFERGNGEVVPIEPKKMTAIFKVISKNKKIECVVLNACNSYMHVEAIKPFVSNIVYTNDFVLDSTFEGKGLTKK